MCYLYPILIRTFVVTTICRYISIYSHYLPFLFFAHIFQDRCFQHIHQSLLGLRVFPLNSSRCVLFNLNISLSTGVTLQT